MIGQIVNDRKKRLDIFISALPSYIKYGFVNKIIETLLIFPVFWYITNNLVYMSGFDAVSFEKLFEFLKSVNGIIFLIFCLFIVIFVGLIEIGGYTVISNLAISKKPETGYKNIFLFNIRMLPKMINPGSLLFAFNLAVIVPLSGIGAGLSIFRNFEIPDFIMSVINDNRMYLFLFYVVLIIFMIFSIYYIFSFQFVMLRGKKPYEAMKKSSSMIRKNFKNIFFEFFLDSILIALFLFLLTFLWINLVYFFADNINVSENILGRGFLLFLLFCQKSAVFLGYFIFVPLEVFLITYVFEKYDDDNIKDIEFEKKTSLMLQKKEKPSILDIIFSKKRFIFMVYIIVAIFYSLISALFFDDFFRTNENIFIVGHRGGAGRYSAENTIESIDTGVRDGASYVEVDVQRTRDGSYILNHDSGFKRVAGVDKKVSQMDISEIKKLDVNSTGQKVPEVREVFEDAKKRGYGIFLELKGETADKKMADDMANMIRLFGLEDKIVIMSLDYDIIKYIEEKYPDINTGFVYFISLGDIRNYKCDYLIFEEKLGSSKNIQRVHESGKKAVVWTVNSVDSMENFLHTDVDGIITDDVKLLFEIKKHEDEKTDKDVILQQFIK